MSAIEWACIVLAGIIFGVSVTVPFAVEYGRRRGLLRTAHDREDRHEQN